MRLEGQMSIASIVDRHDRAGTTVLRRQVKDGGLYQSMKRDGLKVPLILDARTNEVIDGQRRLDTAKKLGWTTIGAVTTSDFVQLAEYLTEVHEFEEKNKGVVPFVPMKPSDLIRFIGTLKRIRHDDIRRKKSQAKPPGQSHGGPRMDKEGTFEQLMVPALGLNEATLSRYSSVAAVWDAAPTRLSRIIDKIVADLDIHGQANRAQRLTYEARSRYLRTQDTGNVSSEELMRRATRMVLSLETIADSATELIRETMFSEKEYNSEEGKDLVRRLRRAQIKTGRLTRLLVKKLEEQDAHGEDD